jgi:hypothetical protein
VSTFYFELGQKKHSLKAVALRLLLATPQARKSLKTKLKVPQLQQRGHLLAALCLQHDVASN